MKVVEAEPTADAENKIDLHGRIEIDPLQNQEQASLWVATL